MDFKGVAMARADHAKIALVKGQNASDVEAFGYGSNEGIYKIQFGVSVCLHHLSRTLVISWLRTFKNQICQRDGSDETCRDIRSGITH